MVYLEKIGTNFSGVAKPNYLRKPSGVNFKGSANTVAKEVGTTAKENLKKLPAIQRFFKWFEKAQSESINVIINAIGTGIFAPLVIAFNPIAKEDDQTKKYTALRQPLSAVLAVVTQVGINIPFQKIIKRLGKQGLLGEDCHFNADNLAMLNRKNEGLKVLQELESKGIKFNNSAETELEIANRIEKMENLSKLVPSEARAEIKELTKTYNTKGGILKGISELEGKKGLLDKLLDNEKLLNEGNIKNLSAKIEQLAGKDPEIEKILSKATIKENDLKKIAGILEELVSKNKLAGKEHLAEELLGKKGLIGIMKQKGKNLGEFGKIAGFILSFMTLVPTSEVLNWVYPRFVERFFPNLVKKQEGKGDNK